MAQQLGSNYYNSPFKFNGKELDEETGFYYYGARYYDPKISIWLSVDPLAEKFPNFNPYNYVMQNPLNLIDPTGMAPEEGGGDPKKNIYVVLDYKPDPDQGKDINRDTISFKGFEENGWHGIYANNLEDAVVQIQKYLKGGTADNIVLETHGGVITTELGIETPNRRLSIDNNTKQDIRTSDLESYPNSKSKQVDSLLSLINNVKDNGVFYLNSCHIGDDACFSSNLQQLTNDRVNIIDNNGQCKVPASYYDDNPSHGIYEWTRFFNYKLSGSHPDFQKGSNWYRANSEEIIPLKSVKLGKNKLNY